MEQVRLDKAIASLGEISRRDVKKLAAQGQVTVNGKPVKRAEEKINPDTDRVCIGGKLLNLTPHIYLMLNNPEGVVSASRDGTEKTVVDLVPR